LTIAAERIGLNGYQSQLAEHKKAGRKFNTFRYSVTEAHKRVVDTIGEYASGRLADDDAMGVLHEHDVLAERLAR
jgi:hypothetical protein